MFSRLLQAAPAETEEPVDETQSVGTAEDPPVAGSVFGGGLFGRLLGSSEPATARAQPLPQVEPSPAARPPAAAPVLEPAPAPAPVPAAAPASTTSSAVAANTQPKAAALPPPPPSTLPKAPAVDASTLPAYNAEDLAKNSSRKSLWMVIDGLVYDATDWQKLHPGGAAALLQYGGRDATDAFNAAHASSRQARPKMKELVIGVFDKSRGEPLEPDKVARNPTKKVTALQPDSPPLVFLGAAAPPPPPTDEQSPRVRSPSVMQPREARTTVSGSPRPSTPSSEPSSPVAGEDGDSPFEVGADINVTVFDELRLEPPVIAEAQKAWEVFCQSQGAKEAAGEAIYNALFEGAPSLQSLFTTPRAVQAMRFMAGLQGFVGALSSPKLLKASVEALAFGHLNFEVTIPRIAVFRDIILELFEIEIGEHFNEQAKAGWLALLNYVGGAIVYIKTYYHERLKILESSWAKASDPEYGTAARKPKLEVAEGTKGDEPDVQQEETAKEEDLEGPEHTESRRSRWWGRRQKGGVEATPGAAGSGDGSPRTEKSTTGMQNAIVVRTFQAMFEFNAAVMGFSSGSSSGGWLKEIVNSFDAIVTNISNTARLQEECDVLVLKIGVCTKRDVNLGDFKACMLATLRSLLPKEWDSNHEVAWNWLWDNVDRLLRASLGKPAMWLPALQQMLHGFDEETKHTIRKKLYSNFFLAAPTGQEHFKQSDTRLHFIADRMMAMVVELLEEPHRMVDDLSALGLRHVGYGIPTELFGPFVSSAVDVVSEQSDCELGCEAFRWSLGLIAKILVRTIAEGSTIVMKAINANSVPQLKCALACAARASRATWLLKVEAGTQSISPLMWAIESGRVEAAEAIIQDLLVIRADRERYYYGVEDLFGRHHDIIKRLLTDATTLLPVLLQGLVWRSRISRDGVRRVNYYVKHLLINPEDETVSETLSWLVAAKNPRTMSHEVIVLVSDTMWNGLICRQFIYSKIWFMISLLIFMLGQAILPKSDSRSTLWMRIIIFLCRLVIYFVTMCRLIFTHSKFCIRSYKEGDTMTCFRCLKIPSYLKDPRDSGGFLLMLLLMLMCTVEPMFHCLQEAGDEFPSETCDAAQPVIWIYSVFCMWAMAIHWLLLIDLSVFSTGLSAFVLVIGQVLSEMTRFLITVVWLLLTFGSAISVLEHPYFEMRDIPNTAIALFSITIRLYEDDYRNMLSEPPLLATVFVFVTASAVVLLNLLIAQINCSYVFIYQDMVGFARLNRADVICETLEKAPETTWINFVKTLKLDEPLEFNEGDVGLAGGIQVLEPAGLHPVTEDRILRFGGSCALDMPWPEDAQANEEDDHLTRISKMLKKVLKRVSKTRQTSKTGSASKGDSTLELSGHTGSQDSRLMSSEGSDGSGGAG